MAFTTKKSLLAKVRAGDEVSWEEFYEAYRPLILLCGGDCSLTPDENEELVQQVMTELFTKDLLGKYDPDHIPENVVFHYDPKRGRFRHFSQVSAQPAPSGFEADSVVCSATNRNNGRTAWDVKDEIIGRRNCQNIGTAA